MSSLLTTPTDTPEAEKTHDIILDDNATRDEDIKNLARKLTQQSGFAPGSHDNVFHAEIGSSLDPNSDNFRPRHWAEALVRLNDADANSAPRRTAGIAFRNLNVHGFGTPTDYQKTVGNVWLQMAGLVRKITRIEKPRKIEILHDFEGLVRSGEMLVVLGPPGSGCSTLLKTIAGEIHGIHVAQGSELNYQGISSQHMQSQFRGEAIYTAEVDVHFPMLSVGDTLLFAALARAPRNIPGGVDRWTYATHMRDVMMTMFGIRQTLTTQVGDDFLRGVSGGERKRVSIAEAALSGAPLQCWDNSTRGLDSANAVEFCKTLRQSTDLMGATACVAIYQAPQAAYDMFDKVTLLYDGHQIYFGSVKKAKKYFEDLGFLCPEQQTDGDFLTSMTSPEETVVRPGWEGKVPRTALEFSNIWKASPERAQLLDDIDEYNRSHPIGGEHLEKFAVSRRAEQSTRQRKKSPYTLDYYQQIKLCLWRGFQRLKGDPSLTITQLIANFILSVVIGSVFFNLDEDSGSFFSRGSLLFFAVLINATGSSLEILTLYAQRGIVEKHARYALYHPSAEAFSSMLVDLPYKILNVFTFNIPLYFMANLRREAGPFFFMVLTSFLITIVMSMVFRTIAATSRTLAQALAPGSIVIASLLMYSGFALPKPYILGWSKWIYYLDPLSYAFESLMVNEFSHRAFHCSEFVPNGSPVYGSATGQQRVCSAVGSKPGLSQVIGDDYINSAFHYYHRHKWTNLAVVIAYTFLFCATYIFSTEYITEQKSKGEVLLFRRGAAVEQLTMKRHDEETALGARSEKRAVIPNSSFKKQTSIFHWEDLCYKIKIKDEERSILDHVDGWVKPGTLTALMGVSGAGKTTLLDVLASRVTMGVISGGIFIDGEHRDNTFQRKTGYVQQQDLHLSTSTVREALNFSALLRQPPHIPREEKLRYVNEVIELLDMELYADAVVGVPGEGLNVEQRKRLTIGVELASRPQLLLFLDEPTSGLDSQTSWIICNLMEKLKNSGQAILCTIHQPSAMLFQRFDRLLFLAKGGKTVYFGEIGKNSTILQSYFERNGARGLLPEENPAEWMLSIVGAAPGSSTDVDWHSAWRTSAEYNEMKATLAEMRGASLNNFSPPSPETDHASSKEFAAPLTLQFREVTLRVFQQYWRTPSYIYSKAALCILSAVFIGFSFFKAKNTLQGLQNQTFSLFMLFTLFGQMAQQIMPHFVTQRSLYEACERPSKTYSWKAFIISNIIVEIPWNIFMSVFMYCAWYYAVGMDRNATQTNSETERGGLMFLFMLSYLIFTSTFSTMIIAGIEQAAEGANLANLMFSLSLMFCGVLATKDSLPGFWIFMYRVSPFTYLVSGMLSTSMAHADVTCAANEYLIMQPPGGQTCGAYLAEFVEATSGYLLDGTATRDCQYCSSTSTDTYLSGISIFYDGAWRNLGITWGYILFNTIAALGIYWLVRMPKKAH
ncbi:BcATRO, ABC transporter [Plenodomus tracheiphilus IPT5]|uniref:BcATRO, ABC transporter n=1 Tax=Plenodomus tracheiphilus IPT5 TaxID=1408161 RepID=A0A6A7ASJ4_9PLEO|nr:BcATRO, ABC transporter [Plenodomus tracheiphilus IPT5]